MMAKSSFVSTGHGSVLDKLVILLLIYLFATLPFAVIDLSLPFTMINRFLLIMVGILCAFAALSKRSFKVRLNATFVIFGIVFIHSLISMLRVESFDYAKEVITFFALAFIVIWARDVRVNVLAKAVIIITLLYCIDAIYQYVNGIDLFGFPVRNNRNWGAFYFGAPTFGVFLSFVFFLPFFYLKNGWLKLLVIAISVGGLIVANDRAPIVQIGLALLLFMPCRPGYRFLLIGIALAPILLVPAMEPSASNRLIALYWGLNLFLFEPESAMAESFLHSYGLVDYLNIWKGVIDNWFRWDNSLNILFGTGWGSSIDAVRSVSEGGSRPHSIHLDILIVWGIVGYILVLGWLIRLYWHHRETFVIYASVVLPFNFFSLTSSNHLFLMTIIYILFVAASRGHQGVRMKTGADQGVRGTTALPCSGRA